MTYEFIVPSAVWLVDPAEWPPISVVAGLCPMRIQKPIIGHHLAAPLRGTVGNEGIAVDYTIMRVEVDPIGPHVPPDWSLPFAAARECLTWIRVLGRQYWLGVMMSATHSITRGSIIKPDGSWTNFAATQTPIMVDPLSKKVWEQVGVEMQAGNLPSIPDLLLCDALLSIRDHDYLQATIRLGVVCELELNAFIEDLLSLHNETVAKLYEMSRPQFDWKFKNVPALLGAEKYQVHNEQFAAQISKLYELRGSAIHRAQCFIDETDDKTGKKKRVGVAFSHVSTFMFAVEDFLLWTKNQRLRLGLPSCRLMKSPLRATLGAAKPKPQGGKRS